MTRLNRVLADFGGIVRHLAGAHPGRGDAVSQVQNGVFG
jgi:hypothetical protein